MIKRIIRKLEDKKKLIIKITASVLLCFALFCAVLMLGKANALGINPGAPGLYLGLCAVALILYEILVLCLHTKIVLWAGIFNVAYILSFVALSILAFLSDNAEGCFWAAGIVFFIAPLFKRVASIIRNHTARNVIINVLVGVVNAFLLLSVCSSIYAEEGMVLLLLLLVLYTLVSCLYKIFLVAVSDVNMGLLHKIIRKTYAGEIIFGLMLLIISFSIAFVTLEDSITSFGDALWYCFAIVTTIGFGDITATSILGRVLSVVLGIYGLIVVAIITSIIVNFYNEVRLTPDSVKKQEKTADILPEDITDKVAGGNNDGIKDADTKDVDAKDAGDGE